MTRIVHVPYTYYPDPVGGTEIYVEQLVDGLVALGLQNLVFAPGTADAAYTHRGVEVERLGVDNDSLALGQLYGAGDEGAARKFGRYLEAHKPDVVHLHAFTRIVSARTAEQARRRNIPVVFTYHTPTVSCLRSGLMRWGSEPCDGKLDTDLCTRCRLHSLGLPRAAATLVARLPQPLRALAAPYQGGMWTALRMRDLIAEQHTAFHALMDRTNLVVALGDWTKDLLVKNGVATEKIVIVPHGMNVELEKGSAVPPEIEPQDAAHPVLRIAALGRLEPIKGIHLLVKALKQLPNLPVALDIFGIVQDAGSSAFEKRLRRDIARDPRIRLLAPVPHAQVIGVLRQYDILAVPSQWFETGPLVVLEAFAAGIPVMGSNLGGIAEKVTDGVNGILLPSLDVDAWREALRRLAQDRAAVERMRAQVRVPRSLRAVAAQMKGLYEQVMQQAQVRG